MSGHRSDLPVIDLGPWRSRRDPAVVAAVDRGFRESGFLLVADHGVAPVVLAGARATARAFFALPPEAKARCVGSGPAYRGWFGPGSQSNGASAGLEAIPDLKETFAMGAERPPDGVDDPMTYGPNRFPDEVPAMASAWTAAHGQLLALAETLTAICEAALGFARGAMQCHFAGAGMNAVANWYPSASALPPTAGACRIGPHTDFGTLSILDRERSPAGLQIADGDGWRDVPVVPGTLTVNVGDLLAHWSGGRWRSTVHRVPAPDPSHDVEEGHLSIVAFHRPRREAAIVPVAGGPTVRCGEWLDAKMAALAVGPDR